MPYTTLRACLAASLLLLANFIPVDYAQGWLPSGSLLAQNTYNVSQQYGYSPTDATAFLQAALNDPTAAVIVIDDLQGSTWITDGLLLTRDNVRIEFAPGVEVEALAGALGQFESLLNIRGCSNVFVEGNGGTMRIDKSQYPSNSEFRHCILTRGPQNVTIQNLLLTGAAGDGIEVGPDFVPDVNDIDNDGDFAEFVPTEPTQNLTLNNLVCDANNRQGMSVVSVIGLTVNNCTFSNTQGTEPESGVDFEPFQRYQPMQGIVMTGCTFSGNHGNGIQFGGVDIDASSPPSSILIQNALVTNNGLNPNRTRAGVDINNIYNPNAGSDQTGSTVNSATGSFALVNSTVRDEPYPGINVRQYASGLDVTISNVTVENCANTLVNFGLGPIIVQPPFYGSTLNNEPCFGNVEFTDVTVIDDQTNRAHVTVDDFRAGPTGPADVSGNINVSLVGAAAGTSAIYLEDGDDCGNFTLTVTTVGPLPVELTSFGVSRKDCTHELSWEVALAEQLERFVVEESSDGEKWATARPLTGSSHAANVGSDVKALGAHWVTLDGTRPAFYRLRSDFRDGTSEYSELVYAEGCVGATELKVWPNPTTSALNIAPSAKPRVLGLYDALGRQIQRFDLDEGQQRIQLTGLSPGLYVLVDEASGQIVRLAVE